MLIKETIPSFLVVLISFIALYYIFYSHGITLDNEQPNIAHLEDKLESLSNMLVVDQNLRNNGITTIYGSRQEFLEELTNELSSLQVERNEANPKEIWLMGISLRDFFNPQHIPNEKLRLNIQQAIFLGKVKLRAIIIDPSSAQASLRKEADGEGGPLDNDVINTLKQIGKLQCTDSSIEIRQYTEVPASCFIVRVSNYIVVEQYHSGGRGGEIPIIKYALESEAGKRFSKHFEFIWNHRSTTKRTINECQPKG